MKNEFGIFLFLGALAVSAAAQADTGVSMNPVDENGVGKEIGQVTISETQPAPLGGGGVRLACGVIQTPKINPCRQCRHRNS